MSDVTIPEAVLKLADEAEARFMGTSVEVIAQAILAERQRCEKICVERAQEHRTARHSYADEASQNSCLSDAIEALSCAHAIRSSHE